MLPKTRKELNSRSTFPNLYLLSNPRAEVNEHAAAPLTAAAKAAVHSISQKGALFIHLKHSTLLSSVSLSLALSHAPCRTATQSAPLLFSCPLLYVLTHH